MHDDLVGKGLGYPRQASLFEHTFELAVTLRFANSRAAGPNAIAPRLIRRTNQRSRIGESMKAGKLLGSFCRWPVKQDGAHLEPIPADTPIAGSTQDLLDRSPMARRIAQILATPSAPDGRVFAIRGAWGFGKSSLKNLVIEALAAWRQTFRSSISIRGNGEMVTRSHVPFLPRWPAN
jgi:hypothetical protein